MKTNTSKPDKPKHPIGTHFQKKFIGFGIWEGCITSFDGEDYEVRYVEDNYIEFINEEDMDDIIAKSNKYVQNNVKVETLQTQQLGEQSTPFGVKRNRMPTDRYAPAPTNIKQERQSESTTITMKQELPTSTPATTTTTMSFTVGQHVWVSIGREMHSAKIKELLASNMAKVQWTTMLTYAVVSMDDIKPMFDSNGVSSKFSRRKRGQTDRFVPPPPTKQERNTAMTKKVAIKRDTSHRFATSKKQYSPTKRGNKKAAAKRVKSPGRPKKQYTLMKREQHQNQLPKQKSREELRLEKEKEEDYKSLWDLYLEPKVRKNEELPSGMCLRQKTAICGLLRCKTSLFRKQLHKTIIRLDKEGKKDNVHHMLKQMREHDETGAAGDGPKGLIDEILDISDTDNDEVAFVGNITTPSCVKRDRGVIDVEKQQPKEGVNANRTFEPIGSVEREQESNDSTDMKLAQEKVSASRKEHDLSVTEGKCSVTKVEKSGANVEAAKGKRAICSPSVVDSLDELEPKRFKRSEESIDISTVSSLTFPGGESRAAIPQIPTEITIRRRAKSTRSKYTSAKSRNDASETPSTNVATSSSDDKKETMHEAVRCEKMNAADRGAAKCMDLCESSDQTIPYRGDAAQVSDQVEIIDVDVKAEQIRRRQPSSQNEVFVLD
mmetsp:Transcript_34145/g.69740  ORF Transcript_34145/g.69740 Transcript_34145/m.69740 type:complete len:662 (-) Transcript_34145:2937-4922(-)